MNKKICFPFINGDMQAYCTHELSEKECEDIYNGKTGYTGTSINKLNIEWRPLKSVELTLNYVGFLNIGKSVVFIFEDENRNSYPVSANDMDKIIKKYKTMYNIFGIFNYTKNGKYYGIKIEEENK